MTVSVVITKKRKKEVQKRAARGAKRSVGKTSRAATAERRRNSLQEVNVNPQPKAKHSVSHDGTTRPLKGTANGQAVNKVIGSKANLPARNRSKVGNAAGQAIAFGPAAGLSHKARKKDIGQRSNGKESSAKRAVQAHNRTDLAHVDRKLVERCLSGDSGAWTRLYNECHSSLLVSIRALLGANAAHQDLVEEIGAKVWFAVIDRNGQLLSRFDSNRGCRLSTFLSGLAKNEIARYFRTERQRSLRETAVCRNRDSSTSDSQWHSLSGLNTAVREFLATLTPSERDYCEEHLLASDGETLKAYSDANRWQLNHRVRLKLWAYLENP